METPQPENKSRFADLRNAALADLRSKNWELSDGEDSDEVVSRLNFLCTSEFDFKTVMGEPLSNTLIAYSDIQLGKDGVEYKVNALNFNLKEEESTAINVHTIKARDEFGPIISKEFYSFEYKPGSDTVTVSLLSKDRRIPDAKKWVFRAK